MKYLFGRFINPILLLVLVFSAPVTANGSPSDAENPYKKRPHVIGVQASSIGGVGLDYKYAFGDIFHWRITGMVFPSKSGSYSSTFYNMGTDLQFNVFQVVTGPNTFMRGYIAPAIGLWGYKYDNSRYNTQDIHAGLNLGFELVLASRFSIHGELGLGYYHYGWDFGYDTSIAGGIGIGLLF